MLDSCVSLGRAPLGTAVVLRREPAGRLPPAGFHPHATPFAAGDAGAALTVLQPGCRTLLTPRRPLSRRRVGWVPVHPSVVRLPQSVFPPQLITAQRLA